MSSGFTTYYDILRVARGTDPQSLRSAYRSLAQQYHPDKRPGSASAAHVMAALNEAYAVLSDPQKRASYDRTIEVADSRAAALQRIRETPPAREAAWPWWLLFATITFAFGSVATVVYTMTVPSVAVPVTQTSSSSPPPAAPTKVAHR
jgi:curved DNA-binding protein CbpA